MSDTFDSGLGHINLCDLTPSSLNDRYRHHLLRLNSIRADLKVAVDYAVDDFEYGGAAAQAQDIEPIERNMREIEGDLARCEAEIRKRAQGLGIPGLVVAKAGDVVSTGVKVVRVVKLGDIPRGDSYVGEDDI